VKWTIYVDLHDLREIPGLLQKRVTLPGKSQLVLDKTPVTTCAQFLDLVERKIRPRTNAELARASFFEERCSTLKLLGQAHPSRASYVAGLRLTPTIISLLPPTLGTALSHADAVRAQVADVAGQSWVEFNPKLRAIQDGEARIQIIENTAFVTTVTLLAYGDFTGDGIEDLLLFVTHRAAEGSYHADLHMVLTRKRSEGRLNQANADREREPR
jgi:hypothetical protein